MHGLFDLQSVGFWRAFDQFLLMSASPRRRELLSHYHPQVQVTRVPERRIEKQAMAHYASLPFSVRAGRSACALAAAKAGLMGACEEEDLDRFFALSDRLLPSSSAASRGEKPTEIWPRPKENDQELDWDRSLLAFPCLPGQLILAADTMVVFQETIYDKPTDLAEAEGMLRAYFGQTHEVVTGVCLRSATHMECFYSISEVGFAPYHPGLEKALQAYLASSAPLDKAGAYGIQELDPRFIRAIYGDYSTIIGLPVAEIARRIAPYYCDPEPMDFISLDQFTQMAEAVLEDLPPACFEGLNGQVQIHPEAKLHPEALDEDLYIMGQYVQNKLGQHIDLFYGSFRKHLARSSRAQVAEKLREVLYHEFRHHLEGRAGRNDLALEDAAFIQQYKDHHYY